MNRTLTTTLPTLNWRIGGVSITRVAEVELPGLRWVLPDATPENLLPIQWLAPHFITPEGEALAAVQTFIVESQNRRIMVDTCIGNDKTLPIRTWNNRQGPFLADLEAAGFPPDSIDTVLCTHLHMDHVGWNTVLDNGKWRPTFPRARYLFGRAEWEHWDQHRDKHAAVVIEQSIQPILDAGLHQLVETNHQLTDEVRLEPSPGHTPGHVSVRIVSNGMEAVITGDLMHHPAQITHPEWACVADIDPDQARATRRAFVQRHAGVPTLVIGTHFAAPTAGRIVAEKGSYRLIVD